MYSLNVTLPWSRGYKTFFMLNSAEHEILTAHKYWNRINGMFSFKLQKPVMYPADKCWNATIVGILTFMSMLSWVENEKFFL